jgi:L-aspartate oxidase
MTADVIIVGAGIAGLICALECTNAGKHVIILHQDTPATSASNAAQGGIAAAIGPADTPDLHADDTMVAGCGLCHASTVAAFCKKAPAFIDHLIQLGVTFDTNPDGTPDLTREGGHSHARVLHVKDYTGKAIVSTLVNRARQCPTIQWLNAPLEGLLTTNDRVVGAIAGNVHHRAAHVVLATGGYANMFMQSTNPSSAMGEGIALAHMVGADLADLEFIQFHPTVHVVPGHAPWLLTEALRGEGAYLVNAANERFMPRYHPMGDLAPRDIVARAIVNEGPAKLNLMPLANTLNDRFPTVARHLTMHGIDPATQPVPVTPSVHYTLGGIKASMAGETRCPGLWAIGECANTGLHGANRLASNSLLEAGIMGQTCGQTIVGYLTIPQPAKRVTEHRLPPLKSSAAHWLKQTLSAAMGVVRHGDTLARAMAQVKKHPNHAHPLFVFGQEILACAATRNMSCGGHYRSDATPTTKAMPNVAMRA